MSTFCPIDAIIIDTSAFYNEQFGVKEAYMLPHDTVKPYARYNNHQNGYILIAKGAVLTDKDTKNITLQLR